MRLNTTKQQLEETTMIKKRIYLSLVVVVAVLCLAGYAGNAQRSSSANQTWEYKLVGVSREDAARQQLEARLNFLGGQGWELVAIEPSSSTMIGPQVAVYCFKRLK
jgi:hypothetical protein